MWSYEDQQEYFASMAQTDNATHLTLGYKNINMGNKKVETSLGMPPMQEERTYSTLTSTNAYPLPERFIKMDQLYVVDSGGQRHYADPEYSEDAWRGYMRNPNTVVSDILQNVFVRPGLHKFEVFPIFATASLTMTMIYSSFTKDLTASDYVTGTVAITSGGTTVTFTGSTLTAAMAGRWIKPATDGNWYNILSVNTGAGTAILLMPYQGTTVTTDTFVIGELPRTPEGTHDIAVNYALWMHFLGPNRDVDMAKYFAGLYKEGIAWATEEFGSRYSSAVIPSQRAKMRSRPKNPNDYPDLSSLA